MAGVITAVSSCSTIPASEDPSRRKAFPWSFLLKAINYSTRTCTFLPPQTPLKQKLKTRRDASITLGSHPRSAHRPQSAWTPVHTPGCSGKCSSLCENLPHHANTCDSWVTSSHLSTATRPSFPPLAGGRLPPPSSAAVSMLPTPAPNAARRKTLVTHCRCSRAVPLAWLDALGEPGARLSAPAKPGAKSSQQLRTRPSSRTPSQRKTRASPSRENPMLSRYFELTARPWPWLREIWRSWGFPEERLAAPCGRLGARLSRVNEVLLISVFNHRCGAGKSTDMRARFPPAFGDSSSYYSVVLVAPWRPCRCD